jgi:hypothetical protein
MKIFFSRENHELCSIFHRRTSIQTSIELLYKGRRPFSRPQQYFDFCVKTKSTEVPDDTGKDYFPAPLNWFFDPHPYSTTGMAIIYFDTSVRSTGVSQKPNERFCKINLCNIIGSRYWLSFNTNDRNIFWGRKTVLSTLLLCLVFIGIAVANTNDLNIWIFTCADSVYN